MKNLPILLLSLFISHGELSSKENQRKFIKEDLEDIDYQRMNNDIINLDEKDEVNIESRKEFKRQKRECDENFDNCFSNARGKREGDLMLPGILFLFSKCILN